MSPYDQDGGNRWIRKNRVYYMGAKMGWTIQVEKQLAEVEDVRMAQLDSLVLAKVQET